MTKEKELLKLAKLRQSKVYDGYTAIADYANKAYECNYISPYSKSAHNQNADVLVILQDWSSKQGLDPEGEAPNEKPCSELIEYGYSLTGVKTNTNLKRFLKQYLELELKDTYATNLFPYIKDGGVRGKIKPKYMQMAAREFTLPMIDIIKPKIAIALGLLTFNALRQSLKLKKVYNKDEAIKNTFNYKGVKIFFQAHPASSTTNDFIKENWGKMKKHLDD